MMFPKNPSHRSQRFRDLARDEDCTALVPGVCCGDSSTTILAHSNKMADGKGRGYKASDERSIFCCHTCHGWIDSGKASPEEKDAAFAKAQERTKARLVEIAESPSVRAWKRDAAQWALNLLN